MAPPVAFQKTWRPAWSLFEYGGGTAGFPAGSLRAGTALPPTRNCFQLLLLASRSGRTQRRTHGVRSCSAVEVVNPALLPPRPHERGGLELLRKTAAGVRHSLRNALPSASLVKHSAVV
ncbi:hypothetical protein MTO96_032594 [Rhipicephalus appendiculatus]